IMSFLRAVPSYFSQAVITRNRDEATLAFGIRLMPLSRQQRVIEYMRSRLHPPPGVSARLAGLPVLAAQADAALSSSGRRILMLREFGLVTLIDLSVSLAGVLLVLPSVLALSERDDAWVGVRELGRRVGGALPRRRRARVA